MVPTFTVIRCLVRRPALPLRYRHGYAAVLHRGLPTGKINPAQEFPTRNEGRVRTAIQPRSTGFELAEVLRCFKPLVPLVHLPVWLAGPAPSGSSGASRRCRGCSPPDPVVSPDPAAPSFNHFAATEQWCGSHTHTRTHSASWRTVSHLHPTTAAPRGALPHAQDATGEGASYIPGAAVLTRPTSSPRPAPAALLRLSPYTPLKQPISEARR